MLASPLRLAVFCWQNWKSLITMEQCLQRSQEQRCYKRTHCNFVTLYKVLCDFFNSLFMYEFPSPPLLCCCIPRVGCLFKLPSSLNRNKKYSHQPAPKALLPTCAASHTNCLRNFVTSTYNDLLFLVFIF